MPNSEPFETFVDRLALAWGVAESMRAYAAFLDALFAVRIFAGCSTAGVADDTASAFRSKCYAAGIREAVVKHEHREAARWQRVSDSARAWGLSR